MACRPSPAQRASAPASQPAGDTRTEAQVEALIAEAGRTPPDWWDSVPLNHPATLDLTWAQPSGPWAPDKWLGQYFWGVINPNPGRWKEGVRLLHHVLTVNKNDPAKTRQTMAELGRTYAHYLNDWPRAAFWWRKAGAGEPGIAISLAWCYWEMGCKPMAVAALGRVGTANPQALRLWGEMGETDRALRLAPAVARQWPYEGNLAAGDVCRAAGRYPEAVAWYQKVLALPPNQRAQKFIDTAKASLETAKAMSAVDLSRLSDGVYSASSTGFRGEVVVAVTVRAKRIESVRVTGQKDDGYFYHRCVPALTDRIVAVQGLRGVDTVSGATVTADAIINATAKALAQAVK